MKKEETKPNPEKYGWHEQQGFEDEPSGWMLEGGEDAYYKALKEWEEDLKQQNENN
jgi:hypothetical protein